MTYLSAKTLLLTGLIFVGSVGMAHAEAEYYDVVRSTDGQIVHSTNGNCVRTHWLTDQDFCAPKRVAQATVSQRQETRKVTQQQKTRAPAQLTQEERTVYFQFDRAALLPEAKDRLNTLANVLKSNESVKEAKIVGYTDRIGSVSYNERLSQKRAETVRDYLIANGYTNARVTETRWVGKSEPSTNCPAEARSQLIVCLQNDRRVEAEIEYFPEEQKTDAR
jgi:outer membrane protein OmpA-like peptidoglycan-associated protein